MLLKQDFYHQKTLKVAKALLGKKLVRRKNGKTIAGIIVETEAYLQDDPASHSYRGITPRCAPMFGPGGRAYVYFTYGMYYCFNVVTEKENYGGAVLIRALEPLEGIKFMQKNRQKVRLTELTNGPGKLCQALAIDKRQNNQPLYLKGDLYIKDIGEKITSANIIQTTRIGITDAAHLPYRFYLKNNPWVSRVNQLGREKS
jgi:DNA-3-methyladenine glycosylase